MPRDIKKQDLPSKTCPVCARPFAWRKKWRNTWDQVIYCSERCRRTGRPDAPAAVAEVDK
jgi:hypothetical protein